ncbi:extracellular solute-binding protein [Paenibacillaceae bacterium WGS1546]|uniref:extracellular solute-binding protein n=1 Tax=Cohnella sp. WGS1546 TaxID=3366810 RepID=UPI00372CEE88
MLRKMWLLTLVVVMVFVVAGCGAGNKEEPAASPSGSASSPSSSGEGGDGLFSTSEQQAAAWNSFAGELQDKWKGKTLNIVSVSDPWIDSMSALVGQFEKLTGAKINISTFGYDAAYSKEILTGSEKSAAEDLFVYDVPWIGAMSDMLLPLDDYLSKTPELVDYDDFFDVMRKATTWNGEVKGLPFAPYFIMYTYNKSYFDKVGIAAPPANFDEFFEAAKLLTKNEALPNVFGASMNNQSGTAVGQAFFEYIYNFGGKPFASVYPGSSDYYADMTPQFASEQSLAVVKLFKDMLAYEPDGALNMSWNDRASTFASGRTAMMSPWVTDIAPLSDPEKSAVSEQYATAPLPTAEGVDAHTPVGGYSLGINRYSANADLAWDFLVWFTSPQIAYQFADTGGFPNRYSVLKDETLTGKYAYYPTLQQVVDTAFPAFRPQIPEAFKIIDTLGTYIGEYLAGAMELEPAMAKANAEIGNLLKQAGYTVNS